MKLKQQPEQAPDEIKGHSSPRVKHPRYYQTLQNSLGVEAWDICKEYGFLRGTALKYLLRAGSKTEAGMTDTEKTIEDLKKAIEYIAKEINDLRASEA